MIPNPSFMTFVLDAGLVVKLVMLILLLASVFSWSFIIQRGFYFSAIHRHIKDFTQHFWSGVSLNDLYEKTQHVKEDPALTQIFNAGFAEYQRLHTLENMPANAKCENIERAMRIACNREIDELQENLNFLATVGSVSPYIGLFGTVWGIMTSFTSLGTAQQATIAMVAPGISEALIATAFGLFAAIPAVIAYNRFTHRLNLMASQMDNFCEELLKILHRDIHNPKAL